MIFLAAAPPTTESNPLKPWAGLRGKTQLLAAVAIFLFACQQPARPPVPPPDDSMRVKGQEVPVPDSEIALTDFIPLQGPRRASPR